MKSREDLFIEQINEKREEAYHELFKEFYRSLVLFAMRYIEEQEEAEDIIQELFVTVWEKKEKFLSYNSFCVFLYRSVRNTCLNRIRHRKIKERYIDYTICHKEDAEDDFEMIEEELYRRLFKVIDELPPRCREVFLLHLEGKGNEEIAHSLQITLLTVKTQKKRAMRYIREQLGVLGLYWFVGIL